MKYCIKCGKKHYDDARFCSNCGNVFPDNVNNDLTTEQLEELEQQRIIAIAEKEAEDALLLEQIEKNKSIEKVTKSGINRIMFIMLMYLVLMNVLSIIIGSIFSDQLEDISFNVIVNAALSVFTGTIFIIVMNMNKKTDIIKPAKRDNTRILKTIAIAVLLTFMINFSTSYIINIIKSVLFGPESVLDDTKYTNIETLIMAGYAVIIAPIIEELVFRKTLYGTLRKYGFLFAALTSGICFGIFHMNLSQGIFTFGFGVILAYVYEKTGKIIYPIILHLINNLIATCLSLITNPIIEEILSGVVVLLIVAAIIGLFMKNKKKIIFNLFEIEDYKDQKIATKSFFKSPSTIVTFSLFGFMVILNILDLVVKYM